MVADVELWEYLCSKILCVIVPSCRAGTNLDMNTRNGTGATLALIASQIRTPTIRQARAMSKILSRTDSWRGFQEVKYLFILYKHTSIVSSTY